MCNRFRSLCPGTGGYEFIKGLACGRVDMMEDELADGKGQGGLAGNIYGERTSVATKRGLRTSKGVMVVAIIRRQFVAQYGSGTLTGRILDLKPTEGLCVFEARQAPEPVVLRLGHLASLSGIPDSFVEPGEADYLQEARRQGWQGR